MKRCSKCKGDGPFYKNKRQPDGLSNLCKECHNAYANQSETGKASKSAWKLRNQRPRFCTYCGAGVGVGKRVCEKCKRVSQYRWAATHADRLAELQRRWREAHPEQHRLNKRMAQQRRVARIKALAATFTAEDWRMLLEEYGQRCAYCGRQGALQQEHITPVALGGSYVKENIVPACAKCNLDKRARTPDQWIERWYERTEW